eukprot:31323-Pelagococcus_subviridis.AAC.11
MDVGMDVPPAARPPRTSSLTPRSFTPPSASRVELQAHDVRVLAVRAVLADKLKDAFGFLLQRPRLAHGTEELEERHASAIVRHGGERAPGVVAHDDLLNAVRREPHRLHLRERVRVERFQRPGLRPDENPGAVRSVRRSAVLRARLMRADAKVFSHDRLPLLVVPQPQPRPGADAAQPRLVRVRRHRDQRVKRPLREELRALHRASRSERLERGGSQPEHLALVRADDEVRRLGVGVVRERVRRRRLRAAGSPVGGEGHGRDASRRQPIEPRDEPQAVVEEAHVPVRSAGDEVRLIGRRAGSDRGDDAERGDRAARVQPQNFNRPAIPRLDADRLRGGGAAGGHAAAVEDDDVAVARANDAPSSAFLFVRDVSNLRRDERRDGEPADGLLKIPRAHRRAVIPHDSRVVPREGRLPGPRRGRRPRVRGAVVRLLRAVAFAAVGEPEKHPLRAVRRELPRRRRVKLHADLRVPLRDDANQTRLEVVRAVVVVVVPASGPQVRQVIHVHLLFRGDVRARRVRVLALRLRVVRASHLGDAESRRRRRHRRDVLPARRDVHRADAVRARRRDRSRGLARGDAPHDDHRVRARVRGGDVRSIGGGDQARDRVAVALEHELRLRDAVEDDRGVRGDVAYFLRGAVGLFAEGERGLGGG